MIDLKGKARARKRLLVSAAILGVSIVIAAAVLGGLLAALHG